MAMVDGMGPGDGPQMRRGRAAAGAAGAMHNFANSPSRCGCWLLAAPLTNSQRLLSSEGRARVQHALPAMARVSRRRPRDDLLEQNPLPPALNLIMHSLLWAGRVRSMVRSARRPESRAAWPSAAMPIRRHESAIKRILW